MTHCKLIYNPYKAMSKLYYKNKEVWEEIDDTSIFINIFHEPISRWLYPAIDTPGFFAQLHRFGDTKYEIGFYGLKRDFEELNHAAELFCGELSNDAPEILLQFMPSYEQELKNRPESKLKQLEELYKQSLHIPYIMNSEIPKLLYKAFSEEIEVGLVAPLSAGKSTMLNAILGRRILPTACEAKTAVITRIIINPNQEQFSVRCRKEGEDWEAIAGFVTKEQVEHLNDMKDAEDLNGRRPVWEMVEVCGRVFRSKDDCTPRFDQIYPQKIFTDTPGINNAQNEQHKELTERLLSEENQNLLIFLFTAENFQTEDTKKALDTILKFLSDPNRLIFVCNRADEITMSYQEQYDQLKELLEGYGISRPNLFLVCAKAAELVRTFQYDNECEKEELLDYVTKDENDALEGYIKKFACKVVGETRKFVKVSDTSNNDPALYHFSALSKPQQMKIDEQVAKLRSEGTEEANWEITLLNSGVPALEMFLSDYMGTQVVSVKLQHLVGIIEQKNLMKVTVAVKGDLLKWERKQRDLKRKISAIRKEIQELIHANKQLTGLLHGDFKRGKELEKEYIEEWIKLAISICKQVDGTDQKSKRQSKIEKAKAGFMIAKQLAYGVVSEDGELIKDAIGMMVVICRSLYIFMKRTAIPVCEGYIFCNVQLIKKYDAIIRQFNIGSSDKYLEVLEELKNKNYFFVRTGTIATENLSSYIQKVEKCITGLSCENEGIGHKNIIDLGCILFHFCDQMDAVTDTILRKANVTQIKLQLKLSLKKSNADRLEKQLVKVEERIKGLRKMIPQMEQFWGAIDHLLELEPLDYGVRSK